MAFQMMIARDLFIDLVADGLLPYRRIERRLTRRKGRAEAYRPRRRLFERLAYLALLSAPFSDVDHVSNTVWRPLCLFIQRVTVTISCSQSM